MHLLTSLGLLSMVYSKPEFLVLLFISLQLRFLCLQFILKLSNFTLIVTDEARLLAKLLLKGKLLAQNSADVI